MIGRNAGNPIRAGEDPDLEATRAVADWLPATMEASTHAPPARVEFNLRFWRTDPTGAATV